MAVGGEGERSVLGALVAVDAEVVIAGADEGDAGDGGGEIEDVAIGGEREFGDALGVEVGGDLGVGGVDEGRVGDDGDGFARRGDGEVDAEFGALVERELDAGLDVLGEAVGGQRARFCAAAKSSVH